MPLSNAERQKRWREKRKAENKEEFYEEERKRRRLRYVPVAELNQSELKKRRDETNTRVKKHYRKKKQNVDGGENSSNETGTPTTSRTRSNNTNKLVVKFPAATKSGAGVRKTYRRALRKSYREVDELKAKNESLRKNNKKLQKRLERTSN